MHPPKIEVSYCYWVISPLWLVLSIMILSHYRQSRRLETSRVKLKCTPFSRTCQNQAYNSLENLLKTKPVTSQSIQAVRKNLPAMSVQHFFSNRQYNHYSRMETRYLNSGYTRHGEAARHHF